MKIGFVALGEIISGSLSVIVHSMNCFQSRKSKMPKSFVECAKGDQRIEIRLLFKEGKTQRQILETLQHVHGAQALSKSSVQRWITQIHDEGDDL